MSYIYPDFTAVRKVLIIKMRHLGDVLLSTPVFSALKRALPHAEIDAYIWKEAAGIIEGHPAISRSIVQDRQWKKLPIWKRLSNEVALLRLIREGRYDAVFNLTEGDRGVIAARVSGAKLRIGVTPKGKMQRKLLTHLVKPCKTPRHAVERDLDVLRVAGIFPKEEDLDLVFQIPENARVRARDLTDGAAPFVLIHAASRWRFKCPPGQLIAEVIDQLDANMTILTGGADEWAMLQEIADLSKKPVLNLAGKTSLKELGALMELALGVITVDSVALHIASALKVPVVALFGPTSEWNWGPWRHPKGIVVSKGVTCRPCLLDGCGGSKRSDCLWSLSPSAIVKGFCQVT